MGCDIHSFVEMNGAGGWRLLAGDRFPANTADRIEPFDGVRNYGVFGFLADVRNYSHSPVISPPRGLPSDASPELRAELDEWGGDAHSVSWLALTELQGYDYDQVFWDRRITREAAPGHFNGAALAEEGEGRHLPLREFLGEYYFRILGEMAALGDPADVRMVFWFDN